jgi:hypothetical protein
MVRIEIVLPDGRTIPCKIKDMVDLDRVEKKDREYLDTICDDFEKSFNEIKKEGDYELDKFIKTRMEMADKQPKGFKRIKILKSFCKVIEENGIDPEQYIGREEI